MSEDVSRRKFVTSSAAAMAPAMTGSLVFRLAMDTGTPRNGPRNAGSRPAHRKGRHGLPQPDFFL